MRQNFTERGKIPLKSSEEDRLYKMDEKDQLEKEEEFLELFDAMSEDEQIFYMEELIHLDKIDDNMAVGFVEKMSVDQKAELAFFLISVVKPDKYPKAYYLCRKDLDEAGMDQYTSVVQEEKRVSKENRGDLVFLAPFIDFRKIYEKDENDDKDVNIIEKYYSRKDTSSKLIDHCIWVMEQEKLLGEDQKSYSIKENVSSIINTYINNRFLNAHLLSHVEELENLDLISKENIVSFFKGILFNDTYAVTTKQSEELKILNEKITGGRDRFNKRSDHLYPARLEDIIPRDIAFKIYSILDDSKEIKSQDYAKAYSKYKDLLDKNFDFVEFVVEQKVFLVDLIKHADFKKEDIVEIIDEAQNFGDFLFHQSNFSDLIEFLEYNKKFDSENDLEPKIVDHVCHALSTQGDNMFSNRRFVLSLKTILEHFNIENQKQIIDTITKDSPSLWVYNISFMVENNVKEFDNFVEILYKKNKDLFLGYLNTINYYANKYNKNNDIQTDSDSLKDKTRILLGTKPSLVLNKDFESSINFVMSSSEREKFIDEQLEYPVNLSFCVELLKSENFANYKKILSDLFKKNHDLVVNLSNLNFYNFKNLEKILSIENIFDIAYKNVDSFNWGY